MASAIELYRKAYELDYGRGDWEDAEELYERIIRDFPHSDEKEYAQVQLERIQSLKRSGHDEEPLVSTKGSSGGGGSVLAGIAFFISLLLVGVCAYFYTLSEQQEKRIESQHYVIRGLHDLNKQNFKTAALAFKKANSLYPGDGLAYRLMTEAEMKDKMERSPQ